MTTLELHLKIVECLLMIIFHILEGLILVNLYSQLPFKLMNQKHTISVPFRGIWVNSKTYCSQPKKIGRAGNFFRELASSERWRRRFRHRRNLLNFLFKLKSNFFDPGGTSTTSSSKSKIRFSNPDDEIERVFETRVQNKLLFHLRHTLSLSYSFYIF